MRTITKGHPVQKRSFFRQVIRRRRRVPTRRGQNQHAPAASSQSCLCSINIALSARRCGRTSPMSSRRLLFPNQTRPACLTATTRRARNCHPASPSRAPPRPMALPTSSSAGRTTTLSIRTIGLDPGNGQQRQQCVSSPWPSAFQVPLMRRSLVNSTNITMWAPSRVLLPQVFTPFY